MLKKYEGLILKNKVIKCMKALNSKLSNTEKIKKIRIIIIIEQNFVLKI